MGICYERTTTAAAHSEAEEHMSTHWHEQVIERPTVHMRAVAANGPWVLRGHPWLIFATRGRSRWTEMTDPDTRRALEIPLHQVSLSSLLNEHAVLVEAEGFHFNAAASLDKGTGFRGPLAAIKKDRAGVGLVRFFSGSVPGAILVIGTDEWRLLIASLHPEAVCCLPECREHRRIADIYQPAYLT